MGRRVGCLSSRVGWEQCIGREGPDGLGRTVKVHQLEDLEEEDTALVGVGPPEEAGTQQVGQLQK